jgi:hypothetical protein
MTPSHRLSYFYFSRTTYILLIVLLSYLIILTYLPSIIYIYSQSFTGIYVLVEKWKFTGCIRNLTRSHGYVEKR